MILRYELKIILEEEVKPKLRMWNLEHIMTHTANCREYRELYKV